MNRVTTLATQESMALSIRRGNSLLADSQRQLSTGKKAADYATLGGDAIRTITARTLLVKTETHSNVSRQTATKLTIYDSHLSQLESSVANLREVVASSLGTQVSTGFQATLEATFGEFGNIMNANDGSEPLFSGSRTDGPAFTPNTLADTLVISDTNAFRSDSIRQTVRLGESATVEYGVDGRFIGTDILQAFRRLASEAPFGDTPTAAQSTALRDALDLLDAGLEKVRSTNSENGRVQARVETLSVRAEARTLILSEVISGAEDANLAEVATKLSAQKTMLEANYLVFSRLSELSLVNYLR